MHLTLCHNAGGNQEFTYTMTNELVNYNKCLDGPTHDGPTFFNDCHLLGGNQQWTYDANAATLTNVNGQCLTQIDGEAIVAGTQTATIPMLRQCDGSAAQQWRMDRSFTLP